MEQNLKRIADSVRLPEDSRTRIRAQIASHREKQEASIMKTKKHLPRLAVALAVLLALSLTAAAVALQKSRGFVITERMSQAEKDQLVEESSIVYARKQIDADGTVHYFNSDAASRGARPGRLRKHCSCRSVNDAGPSERCDGACRGCGREFCRVRI